MNERDVMRCGTCHLNQFLTANGLCRKCRHSLASDPAPDAVAVPSTVPVRGAALIDIAFAIKAIRQSQGMSQRDLAQRMGTFASHISKWELGKSEPSVRTLELLAAGLNVPTSGLLDIAQACCAVEAA